MFESWLIAPLGWCEFQSSPSREAERCGLRAAARPRRSTSEEFQSSPSCEAERCPSGLRRRDVIAFSAPFQSSPSREAGRCPEQSPQQHQEDPEGCFNPRPAVRPGAATIGDSVIAPAWKFQSSPSREAGRCRRGSVVFNEQNIVSILAQP